MHGSHRTPANPKGIVSSSPGLRGTSYPGTGEDERPNRNAVASRVSHLCRNRVAVDGFPIPASQGSSCLATLGFAPESRWDSIPRCSHEGRRSERGGRRFACRYRFAGSDVMTTTPHTGEYDT